MRRKHGHEPHGRTSFGEDARKLRGEPVRVVWWPLDALRGWAIDWTNQHEDGKHVVTGAIDGKVVFYDVESDAEAGHWQAEDEDGIFSVALNSDNTKVLLGSQDGKLHILKLGR